MGFELNVVSHTPQTGVADLDTVALRFLTDIGYMGHGLDPVADPASVRGSVPYRLFIECLCGRPDKAWTVEELMAHLATSRPTVYRHVNKLKSLDLLEEVAAPSGEAGARKAYRLRYGNLAKAWNFTEAHVRVALENYRKTVDHLHDLAQRANREGARPRAGSPLKEAL
ncbi:MAG TPA: helix-turn-helix domain-containing protein [Candidatus Thermoplasmatota archaeon]|nr:helix-turn-helix domain-containing protein [Candidatus Thermoplasmatota archaeon]